MHRAIFTSGHQELHTALSENPLLHWETLLVAATHDLEYVTLELVSKLITADLLCQSLVVELTTEIQSTYHERQTNSRMSRTRTLEITNLHFAQEWRELVFSKK
jgi:hypothetical protein